MSLLEDQASGLRSDPTSKINIKYLYWFNSRLKYMLMFTTYPGFKPDC